MSRIVCTFAAWTLVVAAAAAADNWPEFRGPTGQGIVREGKPPVEFGPDKNVVWKQEIPGKGWSSPIVVAGRVYLTTAVPVAGGKDDQSLRALCLDAASGKVTWDQEVFHQDGATAPRIHGKNSHASPTPLIDGKQLFVHFGHQGTACLDLDGKVLWSNRDIKYSPVHGNGGCPVVVDSVLIFSCDGGNAQFIIGLDRNTGKELWRTERKLNAPRGFSFGTPLIITVQGQKQVVSQASNGVLAYEPRSGKEIWKVAYDGYSVVPRPVFGQGLLFICTGFNTPSLLAIRPDGTGDVTATHVAWTLKRNVPHNPSPVLVGEDLFLIDDKGFASCLEAKTGKVHWQERVGDNQSSSPIYADGNIYFMSEKGQCTVIKAARKFEVLARNDLKEKTQASFAVAGNALFVRTEKNLYCFSARLVRRR